MPGVIMSRDRSPRATIANLGNLSGSTSIPNRTPRASANSAMR